MIYSFILFTSCRRRQVPKKTSKLENLGMACFSFLEGQLTWKSVEVPSEFPLLIVPNLSPNLPPPSSMATARRSFCTIHRSSPTGKKWANLPGLLWVASTSGGLLSKGSQLVWRDKRVFFVAAKCRMFFCHDGFVWPKLYRLLFLRESIMFGTKCIGTHCQMSFFLVSSFETSPSLTELHFAWRNWRNSRILQGQTYTLHGTNFDPSQSFCYKIIFHFRLVGYIRCLKCKTRFSSDSLFLPTKTCMRGLAVFDGDDCGHFLPDSCQQCRSRHMSNVKLGSQHKGHCFGNSLDVWKWDVMGSKQKARKWLVFWIFALSEIHSKCFGNLFFLTLIVGSGNDGNPQTKAPWVSWISAIDGDV